MMKSLKTLTTAVVLIVVTFFWSSCKKEIGKSNPQDANIQNMNLHTRGGVADDPARVERLSTIVSSDYLLNIQRSEQSASRKPVKPGADATPPTVSIASPASGATVSGFVNVIITASDNVGVTSVSLSVDNVTIGSTSLTPYTISWNSGTVGDGNHT